MDLNCVSFFLQSISTFLSNSLSFGESNRLIQMSLFPFCLCTKTCCCCCCCCCCCFCCCCCCSHCCCLHDVFSFASFGHNFEHKGCIQSLEYDCSRARVFRRRLIQTFLNRTSCLVWGHESLLKTWVRFRLFAFFQPGLYFKILAANIEREDLKVGCLGSE